MLRNAYFLLFFFVLIFGKIIATENPEASNEFKYNLAICAIFRDEAPYLEEWIEFHRLVGVEHFFLYNHMSDDNFAEILQPFIGEGVVDLVDWSYEFPSANHKAWISIQSGAYNDALKKYGDSCKWIAFLDSDEFLFPTQEDNLSNILKDYEAFGGLCVNWLLFGTSHVPKIPSGKLLIETLLWRGSPEYYAFHKSVVQPKCVNLFRQAHAPEYKFSFYHVNPQKVTVRANEMMSLDCNIDKIRINHYWTRDEDYFFNHKLKSRQERGWPIKNDIRRAELLHKEYDDTIIRFVPALRSKIGLEK